MKKVTLVRSTIAAILFVTLGVIAFSIFHHPPMRLMPPPLLILSVDGEDLHTRSALVSGDQIELFYATNRFPIGSSDNRIYTVAPDSKLNVGTATLEIDANGSTIDQLLEWTKDSGGIERPYIRLKRMAETGTLKKVPDFGTEEWWDALNKALSFIDNRSVTIYVHGANTTVERATGQASQLLHFSAGNAVVVLFAWPTAENFLKYPIDIRNALESAPKLAELIKAIQEKTSTERINLFSYSAGATVASQTLSMIAQKNPDLLRSIGDVYFAAPDVDFLEFVEDLDRYAPSVHRVSAAVNLGDSALRLAKIVNRASRAGRPNIDELSPEAVQTLLQASIDQALEVVHVDPNVLPSSAATTHSFWYDDPWMSSDVLGSLLFQLPPEKRGLIAGKSESGGQYWYFPEDYPDRISKLRTNLLHALEERP